MLADTLKERYTNTNENTLVAVKATALVAILAHKLPEAAFETLWRTLVDSEGRKTNLDAG